MCRAFCPRSDPASRRGIRVALHSALRDGGATTARWSGHLEERSRSPIKPPQTGGDPVASLRVEGTDVRPQGVSVQARAAWRQRRGEVLARLEVRAGAVLRVPGEHDWRCDAIRLLAPRGRSGFSAGELGGLRTVCPDGARSWGEPTNLGSGQGAGEGLGGCLLAPPRSPSRPTACLRRSRCAAALTTRWACAARSCILDSDSGVERHDRQVRCDIPAPRRPERRAPVSPARRACV